MSIIQEALKKAQNRFEKRFDSTPNIPNTQKIKIESDKTEAPHLEGFRVQSPRTISSFPVYPLKNIAFILAVVFLMVAGAGYGVTLVKKIGYKGSAGKNAVSDAAHQQISYRVLPPIVTASQIKPMVGESKISSVVIMKPETPDLVLNGIMFLENRPRALINGVIVEEGDFIKDAEVRKINPNNVVLNFKDTEITIDLH